MDNNFHSPFLEYGTQEYIGQVSEVIYELAEKYGCKEFSTNYYSLSDYKKELSKESLDKQYFAIKFAFKEVAAEAIVVNSIPEQDFVQSLQDALYSHDCSWSKNGEFIKFIKDATAEMEIRKDWEAAIKNHTPNNVDDIALKINCGISIRDLAKLTIIHKNGNPQTRETVEALLNCCNFHKECSDFAKENYKKDMQSDLETQIDEIISNLGFMTAMYTFDPMSGEDIPEHMLSPEEQREVNACRDAIRLLSGAPEAKLSMPKRDVFNALLDIRGSLTAHISEIKEIGGNKDNSVIKDEESWIDAIDSFITLAADNGREIRTAIETLQGKINSVKEIDTDGEDTISYMTFEVKLEDDYLNSLTEGNQINKDDIRAVIADLTIFHQSCPKIDGKDFLRVIVEDTKADLSFIMKNGTQILDKVLAETEKAALGEIIYQINDEQKGQDKQNNTLDLCG